MKKKTTKRRQKAIERRTQKRKRKATVETRRLAGIRKRKDEITQEMLSDTQMCFWRAHGINYILSDYEEGVWTPVFEGIYDGNLPSAEEVAQLITARYQGVDPWPQEAKAALGWAVSDRKVVYIYYQEAIRRLKTTYPDKNVESIALEPHQPEVWALFNYMREKVLKK